MLGALSDLGAWTRKNAGLELVAAPAPDYERLGRSVREGASDLAWLPPVTYAWVAEGVTPLGRVLRGGQATYAAAIVVREGAPSTRLSELTGARAGWVDRWSAAGYVVPRIELARAGIDAQAAFRSSTFYGSHRAALEALARGDCDVVSTYARAPEGGGPASDGPWTEIPGLRVRVLGTFGPIPSDVIAARRNLAPADLALAAEAFRAVSADPEGRALLRALLGGEELREGLDPGHDVLRRAYERAVASGLFDDA